MNYFELYPGDYLRDTTRLTLVEHGAYLRLLMAYYAEEQPLPADMSELYVIVSAISAADKAAVRKVADRFFPADENGLRRNSRADAEIEKAQKRIATSRANGAKGGRKPAAAGSGRSKKNPMDNPAGTPDGTQQVTQRVTRRVTRRVTQQGGQQGTHSGEALHTPHARPQVPPDTSTPSDGSAGIDTHRVRASASTTPAGEACRAMRDAGLIDTNPAHPALQALISSGATPAQFTQAATLAAKKGKGFAYALGTLRGQLRDAASAGPVAKQNRNASTAAAWLADEPVLTAEGGPH